MSAKVEGWISLLAVMGFVLGFSQGSGPIPWVYLGEILPSEIKGPAAALCTSLNWASNLVVGLTFPAMLAGLHLGGAYLVYAVRLSPSLLSCGVVMLPPTLWHGSCQPMRVKLSNQEATGFCPLNCSNHNVDFDGDEAQIYPISSACAVGCLADAAGGIAL